MLVKIAFKYNSLANTEQYTLQLAEILLFSTLNTFQAGLYIQIIFELPVCTQAFGVRTLQLHQRL